MLMIGIAREQSRIDLSRAQKLILWYRKKILILEQALELVIFFLYQSEPPKNADTLHSILRLQVQVLVLFDHILSIFIKKLKGKKKIEKANTTNVN